MPRLKDAVVNDGSLSFGLVFQLKMENDLGLNLQEKQAIVAEVNEQVTQAQTIVLAEYRGTSVR